jgi:hypothetical protein
MKLEKKFKLKFVLILLTALILSAEISSASLKKVENEDKNEISAESERHKSHLKKKSHAEATGKKSKIDPAAPEPAAIPAPLAFNTTNNTLSGLHWSSLNKTFSNHKSEHFKVRARQWVDNKLFDRQLDMIYKDFLHESNKDSNPQNTRNVISLFTSQFEACDQDHDNVLDLDEFTGCLKNDTYLSRIAPPAQVFANYANNSFTNETGFYSLLYNTLDSYRLNYTNFYDYMLIRLFAFSWSKCSVNGPFIEELNFECAIDIAAGWRTMTRTSARRLYQLALDLSNTRQHRDIDFVTYVMIANSVRLYGLINGRDNSDATKDEFNSAMDSNLLPQRYNQDIINQLFRLIEDNDKPNQGIDLNSFVFYDFALKLFHVQNAARRWYQTLPEFQSSISNYLFPVEAYREFKRIAQNNLTNDAYQMYAYHNISQWKDEENHFLKFTQKNEKVVKEKSENKMEARLLPANFTFNADQTAQWLFNALDYDMDGYINFYDFGSFVQVAYLFAKFDPYNKGKMLAGDIYDKIGTYSDYPTVSFHIRERAKRFNMLNQDLYVDLLRALMMFRIDDIMDANVRRSDKTTLYEVELKHIFSYINMSGVPDGKLNICLRGADDNGVPRYDWECAFMNSMTATLNYLETSVFHATTIGANLALTNTGIWNVDPQFNTENEAPAS